MARRTAARKPKKKKVKNKLLAAVRKAHVAVQKVHGAFNKRVATLEKALQALDVDILSLQNKVAILNPEDSTPVPRNFQSGGVVNPHGLLLKAALYATSDAAFSTPLSVVKTSNAGGGITNNNGSWTTGDYRDKNDSTKNLAAGTYNLHVQARNAGDTADLDTHSIEVTLT